MRPSSAAYQYDLAGRITRETRADGSYWQHGYNTRDELASSVKFAPGGATRFPGLTQAFQYDPIGNRTQWTQGGDANGDNTRVFQFTHDPLNRLLQSTPSDPYDVTGAAPASAAVTIDGQPAQRQGEWFRGEFDAPNQTSAVYPTNIVQVVQGGVTNTASVTTFVPPDTLAYQHDADGNLTRDARWDYKWDAENRLLRVSTRADLPPGGIGVSPVFSI